MPVMQTITEMKIQTMIRRYSELRQFDSFIDRYRYLKLIGQVGVDTFGIDRYINQMLYKSRKWRDVRREVLLRDNGCDLGVDGYEIGDKIIVHHMNPITLEDIEEEKEYIFDPEFLISTSFRTHNAIHYGDEELLPRLPVERVRGDTCLW